MKRIGTALLGAVGLLATGSVIADEPQWTFLQAGYIQGDGPKDGGRSDGFQIKGSVGFLDNWHVGFSYVDGDYDYSPSDIDFDGYSIWAGYHRNLTDSGNTQLYVNAGYHDIDYDDLSLDDTGYDFSLGVRSIIGRVEIEGGLTYTRGEVGFSGSSDLDYTDTAFNIGARYHWTGNFSTGLTATINERATNIANLVGGGDSVVIDFRWSMGTDVMKDFNFISR